MLVIYCKQKHVVSAAERNLQRKSRSDSANILWRTCLQTARVPPENDLSGGQCMSESSFTFLVLPNHFLMLQPVTALKNTEGSGGSLQKMVKMFRIKFSLVSCYNESSCCWYVIISYHITSYLHREHVLFPGATEVIAWMWWRHSTVKLKKKRNQWLPELADDVSTQLLFSKRQTQRAGSLADKEGETWRGKTESAQAAPEIQDNSGRGLSQMEIAAEG